MPAEKTTEEFARSLLAYPLNAATASEPSSINSRWAVDALHDKKVIGRYANDARGFARAEGMRNNCEYIVEGKKVYISSTRKIHKGGEIYVDYGRGFWSLLSRIMKKPDYAQRCRQVLKKWFR